MLSSRWAGGNWNFSLSFGRDDHRYGRYRDHGYRRDHRSRGHHHLSFHRFRRYYDYGSHIGYGPYYFGHHYRYPRHYSSYYDSYPVDYYYAYPSYTSYTSISYDDPNEVTFYEDGYPSYRDSYSRQSAGENVYPYGVSSGSSALEEPADVPENPDIEAGLRSFRTGRYDEARDLFVRSILADDLDGYATYLYAVANFADGKYAVAVLALRRALAALPDMVEFPVDVEYLYGDRDTLLVHLNRLQVQVESHLGAGDGPFLLGYLYFAAGEPEKAKQFLQNYAEEHPEDELAARCLGACERVLNFRMPGIHTDRKTEG